MAEDPKVSARYRELPPEEPPRALDDAILAASRRAVDARPAPLVAPSGRRRWYFPLAAAAVIVLAVAVTVHVERERPDGEAVSGPVATQEAKRKEQSMQDGAPKPIAKRAPAPAPAQPAFTPDPQRNEMQEQSAGRDLDSARRQDAAAPQAPAPAAAPPVAATQAERPAEVAEARRERAMAAQGARSADAVAPLAKLSTRSPEQWLQGIDDLKRQGNHEEAARQLAEFRKRFPDYKIPEAILLKFEK